MKEYLDVLKKYATFTGRSRRREYWMFALIHTLIYIALWGAGFFVDVAALVAIVYGLALLIPNLAATVRRLHDTGRTGWWVLIALVPFIGVIVLIVFLALDSQPGDNAHGANPKGVGAPAAVAANPAPAAPPAQAPVAEPQPAPAPVAPTVGTPPPPSV